MVPFFEQQMKFDAVSKAATFLELLTLIIHCYLGCNWAFDNIEDIIGAN